MMLFCFWESSRVFGPGGSFFVWVGRDEWREGRTEGRTVSLPAGRLQGRAWCGRFAGSY